MYTKKTRMDGDIIQGLIYKPVCTSQPNEQAGQVRKREVSTSSSSASRNCVLIKSVESNVHTHTGYTSYTSKLHKCVMYISSGSEFLHSAGFKTMQVQHALQTAKTAKLD